MHRAKAIVTYECCDSEKWLRLTTVAYWKKCLDTEAHHTRRRQRARRVEISQLARDADGDAGGVLELAQPGARVALDDGERRCGGRCVWRGDADEQRINSGDVRERRRLWEQRTARVQLWIEQRG